MPSYTPPIDIYAVEFSSIPVKAFKNNASSIYILLSFIVLGGWHVIRGDAQGVCVCAGVVIGGGCRGLRLRVGDVVC